MLQTLLFIVVMVMTICEGSQEHQHPLDLFLADLEQLLGHRHQMNMDCTIVAVGYVLKIN